MRNARSILVGKRGRKRLLGRPRFKWEDNIAMELRQIRWEVVAWIHVARTGSSGGIL